MERGSKTYKQCLKVAVPHEVIEISSESTCESTSSDEEERRLCRKKRIVGKKRGKRTVKKEKHESIFKKVYYSDENEDDGDDNCPDYPSIFRRTEEEISPEESCPPSEGEYSDNVPVEVEVPVRDEMSAESSKEEQKCVEESSSDGTYNGESDSEEEKEYLSSTLLTSDPDEHDICKEFEKWLQTADGGRRDEANAFQCSRRIQMVIQYINPESPSLKDLLNKQTLRDCWLTKFEKERQPGTVKSYLGALRQYYSFVQCESPRNIDVPAKVLGALILQMTQWSKSFHKLVKERFWEKRMEDMAKLRKPEQIRKYSCSDIARAAVSMLGDYQEKPQGALPSQAEYTAVRDYLLASICINNGSRSGALANMTVGEFKNAQSLGDSFVVKVKKHKTFSTHGPVNLVLTATLHNWMKIYISRFRSPVADMTCKDAEPVFLTWRNRRMNSSHIGSQINSSWGKVFGKEEASGGATAFRKAAVSAVHRNDKGRREELAALMVHNKATADRYYLLEEKTAAAVETSTYLSKVLHAEVPSTKGASPQKDAEVANTPSSSQELSSPRRRRWVPEEEEAIKRLFPDDIKKRCITIGKVRNEIREDPLLKNISPLKVRDKIRTFFEIETCELPTIPEETREERLTRAGYRTQSLGERRETRNNSGSEYTPSVIAPSTCVSRKSVQKLFVNDEYENYNKLFKDLIEGIKPITRSMVKERLQGEPKLHHLLDRCTVLQLADKVRAERKLHTRNASKKCKYILM